MDRAIPVATLILFYMARWKGTEAFAKYNRPCAHHYVGKSQSCLVSKLRMIWKQTVQPVDGAEEGRGGMIAFCDREKGEG